MGNTRLSGAAGSRPSRCLQGGLGHRSSPAQILLCSFPFKDLDWEKKRKQKRKTGHAQACNDFHEHPLKASGFWNFQQNPGAPSSLLAFRMLSGTSSPPRLVLQSADHHHSFLWSPRLPGLTPPPPGCSQCPGKEPVTGLCLPPRPPSGDRDPCPDQAAMLSLFLYQLGAGAVCHTGLLMARGFLLRGQCQPWAVVGSTRAKPCLSQYARKTHNPAPKANNPTHFGQTTEM